MPPKENDRRVMRTRRALQQALIALLQERELKDISVSELTARADVSRGTFYLHYPDVYELYACTENEMIAAFSAMLKRHASRHDGSLYPVLLDAYTFIKRNAELAEVILRSDDMSFLAKMVEICDPTQLGDGVVWAGMPKTKSEYVRSFIIMGCVGLVRDWFRAGFKQTPADMAALTEQLVINCVRGNSKK